MVTVGLTDEGQNAYRINPNSLQRDDRWGTNIYPKHIHQALRAHLGLNSSAVLSDFLVPGAHSFDFFNPAKSTS